MTTDLLTVAEQEQSATLTVGEAVALPSEAPLPAPLPEAPPAPIADGGAPNSLLPAIIELAKDSRVDVAKLDALLKMQRDMETRQAALEFNSAFVKMQSVLPRIKKDGTLEYPVDKNKPQGPKYKVASFATWDAIDEAIRPILAEHGFGLSFTTMRGADGILTVSAILRHKAGHSTETPGPPLPCDASGGKNNIQGWGSALSYGKRYAATAALNIVAESEDDDGVRAGMVFITPQQAEEIRKLIEESGSDEARFCQFFGVADVSNLTADNLAPARNMLLTRIKKLGAET